MMQAAIAYTSASTALNQKLSENVKASDPINALPKIPILAGLLRSFTGPVTLSNNKTIDQNMNRIVNALESPDMKLTINATWLESAAKVAKKAPVIWYSGAPGG